MSKPFWKFLLTGGKSPWSSLAAALIVVGMAAYMVAAPDQSHPVAWGLLGLVVAVYAWASWRNYNGKQA